MVNAKPSFLQRMLAPFSTNTVALNELSVTPEPAEPEEVVEGLEDASMFVVPLTKRHDIGSYGTEVNAGYPSEEYLQALRGTRRADIFDQMRRGDPQITMCLSAVKNPIKSASWEVVPGAEKGQPPTPEAVADAELIEHILFRDMEESFDQFLSEALTLLDFGHAVFERTDKVVMNHPRFGTYNGIARLGWRSPRTIERWNLDAKNGRLASITQIADGDLSRFVDIPAEFLLCFTLAREGANYEGISALRSCYGPWKRKDLYMRLNAIGIEKFAVPTPIAEIPDEKINSDDADNLRLTLERYTSHESNYITHPTGWKITLFNNTYDPEKVENSVDREDKRIAKSFLTTFLELGISGGGAFALSNDLSDFMLAGLEHVAKEIIGPINNQLIPTIIKMNRGPRAVYPVLKVSGISDKAGTELANMLKTLSDGKWLTPEDADEDHLRKRIGLAPRTGKGVREVTPAPAPSALPQTLAERILLAEQRRLRGSRG